MNTMTTDQLLDAVRKLIKSTEYCFFITEHKDGHPHARLMQPYEPEIDFSVYFGASPRSRKIREIRRKPKVSIAFYNQQETAYVSMLGAATVVENSALRQKYWRSNWNDLFPGGPESDEYVLIKFVPERIEMMNYAHQAMPQPYSLHPMLLVRRGDAWAITTDIDSD
jgi:general stress protein 26